MWRLKMKKLVTGIVAHVDSGKTTLSESILYISGAIRKLGRVDNKDAFLDNNEMERARGITIFSKTAKIVKDQLQLTILDTPGHVDFSAEMERTLQVLDYAILVVSGADGVQGHTHTLWRLLTRYQIPVFLFINKMDQPGTEKDIILKELKEKLDDSCIDFTSTNSEEFYEDIAMCSEQLLDEYMETGRVKDSTIIEAIKERKVFPCYFGSALKLFGVEEFLQGFERYTSETVYPEEFGAKVFKIVRDEQGNRLSYLKITGGSLKTKEILSGGGDKKESSVEPWEEKVNQIRVYSGEKFESVGEVFAGEICAVTGLTKTKPGEGFGYESEEWTPILEPVLTYQIILPDGIDARMMIPKLRQLEEEEPELHIVWDEELKEIRVQVMGEVQIEIVKSLVKERFGVEIEFGQGNIVYKETIQNVVEGVGHFEPLRHYAEVHLLLEPLERGSGLEFAVDCSEDLLNRNWQRLVYTHLEEKEHRGVLTGSTITDMRITLVAGRAHQKHTEGGDFRQATYRAIRQGLKQAQSILLEPYYEFILELPTGMVGRAMTDIEKMYGTFEITKNEGDTAVLCGKAPVATMGGYQKEVTAYTKGLGRLFCSLSGYDVCHNADEVIEQIGYDSEHDLMNPTGSVFCAHGAGFLVSWDQVKDYMHLESVLEDRIETEKTVETGYVPPLPVEEEWIDTEEIDSILARTFHANKKPEARSKYGRSKRTTNQAPVVRTYKPSVKKEKYLLVDGYNIIFAWEELNELSKTTIDGARGKLMDILCNYQGMKKCHLILVFDAYRVEKHQTEILDYHNIHVVYTKEAETADQYIEKFSHENASKYDITVATSDGLEQVIIRGQGCSLLSAREFKEEILEMEKLIRKEYTEKPEIRKNYLFDSLSEERMEEIKGLHKTKE